MPWIFEINETKYIAIYIASAVGSTCGIISNFLLANKSRFQGYFSIVDLLTYSTLSIYVGAYFEGVSNFLLPLPILIFSIFNWKRHANEDNKVELKSLTKKQQNVYLPLAFICLSMVMFMINILISNYVSNIEMKTSLYFYKLFDSFGGMASILLFVLMLKRYKQLNIMNGINNFIALGIWSAGLWWAIGTNEPPSPHIMISLMTACAFSINTFFIHREWKIIK